MFGCLLLYYCHCFINIDGLTLESKGCAIVVCMFTVATNILIFALMHGFNDTLIASVKSKYTATILCIICQFAYERLKSGCQCEICSKFPNGIKFWK